MREDKRPGPAQIQVALFIFMTPQKMVAGAGVVWMFVGTAPKLLITTSALSNSFEERQY
jgi:hypothetical protein